MTIWISWESSGLGKQERIGAACTTRERGPIAQRCTIRSV